MPAAGVFSSPGASISNGSASSGVQRRRRRQRRRARRVRARRAWQRLSIARGAPRPARHHLAHVALRRTTPTDRPCRRSAIFGTCATAATTCGASPLLGRRGVRRLALRRRRRRGWRRFPAPRRGLDRPRRRSLHRPGRRGLDRIGRRQSSIGADGAVLIGPDGGSPDRADGAVLIGADGAVLIAPDGGVFIGAASDAPPSQLRRWRRHLGRPLRIPVTVCRRRRHARQRLRRRRAAAASSAGGGSRDRRLARRRRRRRCPPPASAPAAALRIRRRRRRPVTAGIPIIVPVDDLALRITRPFDHKSSV